MGRGKPITSKLYHPPVYLVQHEAIELGVMFNRVSWGEIRDGGNSSKPRVGGPGLFWNLPNRVWFGLKRGRALLHPPPSELCRAVPYHS
jgi:hypothetical protein